MIWKTVIALFAIERTTSKYVGLEFNHEIYHFWYEILYNIFAVFLVLFESVKIGYGFNDSKNISMCLNIGHP